MNDEIRIAKENALAASKPFGNTEHFIAIANVNAAIAQAEALTRIAIALDRLAIVVDGTADAVRVLTLR